MAQQQRSGGNRTPTSPRLGPEAASSSSSSSLSLPTANTARQHLGTKKKSDTKQIHPGYSMHDWNKLCSSGRDMSGTGGQLFRVTPEELARHCTDKDLWTAVRGVVYNVTLFAKYHPGGKAQLMRGAGQDCTVLFDKIHVWVNSEAILEKCIVGYLVGARPSTKPSNLAVSITKPPFPNMSDGTDGKDVVSIPVPGVMSLSDAGKVRKDSDDTECVEVDLPVPQFHISEDSSTSSGASTAQQSVSGANPSIPVPELATGPACEEISISVPVPNSTPGSGGNVPVLISPDTSTISIPVPQVPRSAPSSDITVSVPNPASHSITSTTSRCVVSSAPLQGVHDENQDKTKSLGVGQMVGRYISTHPLISTTAYETAV